MSIDHFLSLASACHQEGHFLLAETYYRNVLELAPDHRDARLRLAQVLIRSNRFDDGIALLLPLLNRPGDMAAVYRLLGLAETCAGRHPRAIDYLTRALEHAPDDSSIMHFIANLQQLLGLDSAADASFRRAVRSKPMVTFGGVVTPPDYRVLFLFTPGAGNTPFDYLIQGARFDSNVLILLPDMDYDVDQLRAEADVVVNLVSDVDLRQGVLDPAQALIERIGRPIVNLPRVIAGTSRESIARCLSDITGCRVPQTRGYPAAELHAMLARVPAPPLPFPLLARPAGAHGGTHFEKIGDHAQLQAFVNRVDATRYYLTPFVDYRSDDGYFRKYRFIYVDGEILPYHLAIGDQWKVHHATTGMTGHPWMQAEEQAFLDDPWRVFGDAQRAALQAIHDAIGLDYFGIDCALDPHGAIVMFEVNATMLVHGNNEQFPYKTQAVERIKHAFQAMLERRARYSGQGSSRTRRPPRSR